MAQLHFLNGSREGAVVDLVEGASVILGTAADVHVPLGPGRRVSPYHAIVFTVEGRAHVKPHELAAGEYVQDLFVNFERVPVTGRELADRDLVLFGTVIVRFVKSERPSEIGATTDPVELRRKLESASARIAELERDLEQARASGKIEAALRGALEAGRKVPEDFRLVWSSSSRLDGGGSTLTLKANGSLEVDDHPSGEDPGDATTHELGDQGMRDLVAFLVELRVASIAPPADSHEGTARFTLTVGGATIFRRRPRSDGHPRDDVFARIEQFLRGRCR